MVSMEVKSTDCSIWQYLPLPRFPLVVENKYEYVPCVFQTVDCAPLQSESVSEYIQLFTVSKLGSDNIAAANVGRAKMRSKESTIRPTDMQVGPINISRRNLAKLAITPGAHLLSLFC